MDKDKAIDVLIAAATIGQKAGAYDLQSAKYIAFAVETLSPSPEQPLAVAEADTTEAQPAESKEVKIVKKVK